MFELKLDIRLNLFRIFPNPKPVGIQINESLMPNRKYFILPPKNLLIPSIDNNFLATQTLNNTNKQLYFTLMITLFK